MHCDLLIKGGTVINGSGEAGFPADVAVTGDRITGIYPASAGGAPRLEAARTIDATGRLVTPGFVDVHSHSDFTILCNPEGESKIRQGITTEVVGNCGFSAFPLRGATLKEEQEQNRRLGVDIGWSGPAEYFERLEEARPSFNIATFVGHGNIRGSVMGFEDRPATPDDMRAMKRDVEEAMEAGALGMSTGLIYSPGMFAHAEEIIELQRVAQERGGLYASHVRGEGDTLLDAADEFMAVVEGAECQGQFSHLKACGPKNWGKVRRVLDQIEAANARGRNVRFDKYPYVASSTELASLLPRWIRDGGREATLERLEDRSLHDRVIRESEKINESREGWDTVLICEAGSEKFLPYQGWSVGNIARELGMSGGEAFLALLREGRLSTSICNFTMDQGETDTVILHPLGMVCTDASCRAPYGPLGSDCPHPRAYGTFGRFFRDYVKERQLISLEKAVAKVTSLPCETFGLRDRGRVVEGYHADLLVIDWPRYRDRAEFAKPHQYCEGIDAIVVNGVVTVEGDRQTGARGGRVLRR